MSKGGGGSGRSGAGRGIGPTGRKSAAASTAQQSQGDNANKETVSQNAVSNGASPTKSVLAKKTKISPLERINQIQDSMGAQLATLESQRTRNTLKVRQLLKTSNNQDEIASLQQKTGELFKKITKLERRFQKLSRMKQRLEDPD